MTSVSAKNPRLRRGTVLFGLKASQKIVFAACIDDGPSKHWLADYYIAGAILDKGNYGIRFYYPAGLSLVIDCIIGDYWYNTRQLNWLL
ncbi:MAG: hypothetical protein KJ619_02205 [Candidatus Omnitrophica bacterium]|nr:hypothetical protein [Candidatus Omnitrophota bacterium]MBU2251147.1 hypothetical protein [Candidatus Omnitrophota bacterium]MBU2473924.1 hypothetical protein [Candidatus Omnitrophota bacterium]